MLSFNAPHDFLPHGVLTDGSLHVYVADRGKSKAIHVFSLNGEYLKTWEAIDAQFEPLAVRFLDDHQLLVPNYIDSKLYLYDLSGQLLSIHGEQGKETGQFLYPMNVVADKAGNIFVVEEDSNRIQKINFSRLTK